MANALKNFLDETTDLARVHIYLYDALEVHPDYVTAGLGEKSQLEKLKDMDTEEKEKLLVLLRNQAKARELVTKLFQLHIIASFEVFISETIDWIFQTDERTLNAYVDRKVRDIFAVSTLDELKESIRERLTHDLMFLPIDEMVTKLKKNHGVEILGYYEMIYVRYLFSHRNLWLHNRGIVDRNFLRSTKSKQRRGSVVRNLKIAPIFSELQRIAKLVDARTRQHFAKEEKSV